jgi:hypothetical protein
MPRTWFISKYCVWTAGFEQGLKMTLQSVWSDNSFRHQFWYVMIQAVNLSLILLFPADRAWWNTKHAKFSAVTSHYSVYENQSSIPAVGYLESNLGGGGYKTIRDILNFLLLTRELTPPVMGSFTLKLC